MSQWRKVVLQEVPSCKNLIEQADTPNSMWMNLWDKFLFECEAATPDEEKIQQIYRFAARCAREKRPRYLTSASWLFFDYLIGAFITGNVQMRKRVPHLMQSSDFNLRVDIKSHQFSAEKIAEAKTAFWDALRETKKE